MEYQVFISYRRNGTDAHARIFYEKLKEKGYRVFLDFESLFSGGFQTNIFNAIDECTDFVLCLPKDGLDRCNDETDMMKLEIERAISGGKNIIPVFINGFKMPDKNQLPDSLKELTDKNGIECYMEYFDAVMEKLLKNLNSHPKDESLFLSLESLQNKVTAMEHPYFRKWAGIKINEFILSNNDFFDGNNNTNPHSEDTFGIMGIKLTKRSIKAITVVNDYWKDDFVVEYLNVQKEMIEKGVSIQRIFVVDKTNMDSAKEQMEYQKNLGIDVYYIENDSEYIDPEWLKEDYLIQDDELLVQIFCESHKFSEQTETDEYITMSPVVVQNKVERFMRILERSKKYTSK